jgi:CRP/FNR family transcriptional regulator, cyclic AMP receptor protein
VALFPIEVRLARYLLNRLALLAETTQKSTSRLALGMSQGELAMLLGASRPKVNAALIALEDAGAIRRVGQDIECDAEILAEVALVERS